MKKLLKILGIVVVIGVIGAMISGGGNSQPTKTEKETSKQQKVVDNKNKKEVVKVNIASFISEFDENQLAAEKKYEGKIIEVSGYIQNISEDITGTPYISLDKTPNPSFNLTHIKCSFKSSESLTGVKKGQKITVRGEFVSQDMGVIQLKNCEIVK